MTERVSRSGPELGIAEGTALGCSVRVVVTRLHTVDAAKAAVDGVLRDIDVACSRFRADSELSSLNANPEREVRVSPLLATAVGAALRAAELSQGAVDPTVGPALKLVGYDRDFAAVPPTGEPIRLVAAPIAGWRSIHLDPGRRTVSIARGVQIDLGATAKALAADMAADVALERVGGGVLVSVGGDIATRGEGPSGGWKIQVGEDSGEPISEEGEAVRVGECGIATSSTTVRRWTRGGVVLHHIVDPDTGLPVDGIWRTATVVARNCLDANTASTAAIVLGTRAAQWLTAARLPARLVDQDGSVARIAGWPKPAGRGVA